MYELALYPSRVRSNEVLGGNVSVKPPNGQTRTRAESNHAKEHHRHANSQP
jgi:hypothetical protein